MGQLIKSPKPIGKLYFSTNFVANMVSDVSWTDMVIHPIQYVIIEVIADLITTLTGNMMIPAYLPFWWRLAVHTPHPHHPSG